MIEIRQGHAIDVLRGMEAESVHCCITSPPFYGLRDYGLPPIEWEPVRYSPMPGLPEVEVPGCDPECAHEWGEEQKVTFNPQQDASGGVKGGRLLGTRGEQGWTGGTSGEASKGQYCHLCGGWRGSLGLEPTVEMYVGHLVAVFRELWRVMREDGTVFLNFGDSYAGSGKGRNADGTHQAGGKQGTNRGTIEGKLTKTQPTGGLKPKDLIGIPWRVAFALQADGWWLRSDIIWAKGLSFCDSYSGSCMPESVTDRPTKAHEYVFLLAKSAKYFYDSEAVREASAGTPHAPGNKTTGRIELGNRQRTGGTLEPDRTWASSGGRNLRTVWTINPGNFPGAHFATFSPALVEPMVKAGTSERGACPECGSPWERVVEKTGHVNKREPAHVPGNSDTKVDSTGWAPTTRATDDWRPTCTHYDDRYRADFPQAHSARKRYQRQVTGDWWRRVRQRPGLDKWAVVPCTCLDPFGGSGTVGLVCDQLGRDAVLIELNPEYVEMAHDRIYNDAPLFAQVEVMA